MNLAKKYVELLPGRYGWVCCLKADNYQTTAIREYGEWAPYEVEILQTWAVPDAVIFDVGANIGTVMLGLASRMAGRGSIVAFEPQRLPYQCLVANVALNSHGLLVHTIRCPVSDNHTPILVPNYNPFADVCNFGGCSLVDKVESGEELQSVMLDDFQLERLDLIKVDVEGMESAVLRGGRNNIMRHRPVIWAEQLEQRQGTEAALKECCKNFNYRAWLFYTKLYSPLNSRLNPVNYFQNQSDRNVLMIPKEKDPPKFVALGTVYYE